MVILLRLLILVAIIVLVYAGFKYVINPKRKLELAQEHHQFYFLDDSRNVHKNFLLTYKGALFEGEKYLGTTSHSFEVVTISMSVKNSAKLQGFTKDDFNMIEKKINSSYPHAKVNWKSPMRELLKR
ncbi:sigma-w pathway protein ysdB [Bacillus sp. RD4P76]|uniref:Sigma-w pathway protein ysdB n=1 Tax=Bacillus suaedaesalsae TaxID=2810349 RepID=A0ABS2DIY8_9BACI|nr:sigma-w pathway protein ysdB [Bacillus suaedaesalsae]